MRREEWLHGGEKVWEEEEEEGFFLFFLPTPNPKGGEGRK